MNDIVCVTVSKRAVFVTWTAVMDPHTCFCALTKTWNHQTLYFPTNAHKL